MCMSEVREIKVLSVVVLHDLTPSLDMGSKNSVTADISKPLSLSCAMWFEMLSAVLLSPLLSMGHTNSETVENFGQIVLSSCAMVSEVCREDRGIVEHF